MTKFLKLFSNHVLITLLWFGLSFFAVLKQVLAHSINNYFVYKYTFINLWHQHSLYAAQPQYYSDLNHYGPLFALLIAPFTLLPDGLAAVLWTMISVFVLYKAILMLPFKIEYRYAVLLISAHELMTASYAVQFNIILTAFILFSFIFIRGQKEQWAALFIVAGAFTKIYGIVGLAFFFFAGNKPRFILYLLLWSAVAFVLPALFASPHFIIQCYRDWYISLSEKNVANAFSAMQDISVMGMIRRIWHNPYFPNLPVLLPGILLYATAYIRYKHFSNIYYQRLLLASTLIFTVIFSTSSESPTYIIAFVGVAIWFMNLDRPVKPFEIGLLVFALLITSLSPSDLFPQVINRNYIKPYGFKALPCFVLWLRIVYELLTRDFTKQHAPAKLVVSDQSVA